MLIFCGKMRRSFRSCNKDHRSKLCKKLYFIVKTVIDIVFENCVRYPTKLEKSLITFISTVTLLKLRNIQASTTGSAILSRRAQPRVY